ncbi:hypothetical protein DA2_2359 [Desulfovibrio sp. A2]|nr:hypothetical protein DA2_2359 [Desulfovibrio sp. A2]
MVCTPVAGGWGGPECPASARPHAALSPIQVGIGAGRVQTGAGERSECTFRIPP